MNKVLLCLMIIALLIPVYPVTEVSAATFPPGITCSSPGANAYPAYYEQCLTDGGGSGSPGAGYVNAMYYYQGFRDEYRVDYNPPSGVSRYQLYFVSPSSGQVFTGDYQFQPTGTHYLTCNGSYRLKFFDASDSLIYESNEMITTEIQNPSCLSYSDGISGKDDLNANYTEDPTGGYDLSWNSTPGAESYEVWVNGQLKETTTTPAATITEQGSVSIVAKDANGNIIGQSDMYVPSIQDTPPSGGEEGCNVCEKLSEVLQCPEWDTYMGELTGAIKNALPTLPEWRNIADQFVGAFDDYFGEMPTPPTVAEIEQNTSTPLPAVDNSYGDAANLTPTVPADYNNPIDFDLSDAPVIEVVDESQPFTILDPLHNLETSPVGVGVIPGDPNNSSGDITQPQTVEGLPIAIPSHTAPAPDDPGYVHSDIPIPATTPGITPTPGNTSTGTGPIPGT